MTRNPKKVDRLTVAICIALVASIVCGVVFASAAEFKDYTPPKALQISYVNYYNSSGNPSSTPTNNPSWILDYPYRAVFFGGDKPNAGEQGHGTNIFIVFSKTPTIDIFKFTYISYKQSRWSGYIRADYDTSKVGPDKDVRIAFHNWSGLTPEVCKFTFNGWANNPLGYFRFDFYYQCCGNLEIKGLRNITSVPYEYILTCNPGGDSAKSESASPPDDFGDGSSSGSGDGSSTESGDGSSSGSGGGSSKNPWEDVSEIDPFPPYSEKGKGDYGDTGERGDTWTLPKWGEGDVTGEASGFVELKPGGNGGWGPVEIKPGGNGNWGPVEILPGGDGDWGPVEILPGGDGDWGYTDLAPEGYYQGLYDFLEGWW